MKKVLSLMLSVLLVASLAACSGGEASSKESSSSAASQAEESSSAVSSEPVEESSAAEESSSEPESEASEAETGSEYYFKDNVLVSQDVRIEITDWKVIPVGETGNEYGENPVVAFWYSVTNLSGKDSITPMTSWIAMFTAAQDNDPNMVNELEVGLLPDDAYRETQIATIKEGGTVECAIAYELSDTTTPVILTATRGIGGEALGEQTFEIAG